MLGTGSNGSREFILPNLVLAGFNLAKKGNLSSVVGMANVQ